VRCHAEDNVFVSLDGKVKPPVTVNPSLPDIVGVIVLFGPQGRVMQILGEKSGLLVKGFLNL